MKIKDHITVLLVDDDHVDVMAVQRAFRDSKLSCPIIVAENGIEAFNQLRGGKVSRPYMILLDINMPRMNGLEFLSELRKDPKLKESIVFMLTTSKADEDKRKAYQHNIAGYLLKENRGKSYIDTASLLDAYQRLVEFPN